MHNARTQPIGDEANVKRKPLKTRRPIKKPARQIVVQMDRSEEILSALASLSAQVATILEI
jgi:hypothetical protein